MSEMMPMHEGTKQILASNKMCLLRGKITYNACNITWLTVVLDGSPGDLLQVVYEYNWYNESSMRCTGWDNLRL